MSRRINSSQVKAYKPTITGIEYPRDRTCPADTAYWAWIRTEPGTEASLLALREYNRLRVGGECISDIDEEA